MQHRGFEGLNVVRDGLLVPMWNGLDAVAAGSTERVVITKRGKAVGVLVRPGPRPEDVAGLFGCLKDSTFIPADIDLTEPVSERFDAEDGILHR